MPSPHFLRKRRPITTPAPDGAPPAPWQHELRRAVRDPNVLLHRLGLSELAHRTRAGQRLWPLRVPEPFIRRMRRGDPADPLLRQVLPLDAELASPVGFGTDPLEERSARTAPGLLQKYRGRALLITTGVCGIHCRYCFRRHFPYAETSVSGAWEPALGAVRADPRIRELILSGGDPLSLADSRLADLAAALTHVPHLRTLRIHTRLPVVIPSRVCDSLLVWMERVRQRLVVVLHVNHANELDDPEVHRALFRLRQTGATLLNQSVLLCGVNDSVESLCALSEALLDNGVLPYYLHTLDPVQGAAHFGIDDRRALRLYRDMRERLPGYLVPRLVRELPGKPYKVDLAASDPVVVS